jgi:PPP family 3-phenylpropionic acid transporter
MKNTFKYAVVNSGYWMTFCAIYGYANYYMLSKGFLSNEIGIVIAVGNLMAFFIQPIIAAFADNSKKINLKQIIIILSSLILILAIILLIKPNNNMLTALMFAIFITLLFGLQPLINSICGRFEANGININFGIARSMGSLSYAFISYLLGYLITIYDTKIIIITVIIVTILMIISMLMIKIPKPKIQHSIQAGNYKEFFKKYPKFIFIFFGVACLFYFHTFANVFMLQIVLDLGGTAKNLGTIIAIAAAVEIPTMFFFSKLLKKFTVTNLLNISVIFFSIKAFALYLSPSISMVILQQVLQMFAFALYIPAGIIYVNLQVEPEDAIKGQALLTTANTLGATTCSLISGYLLTVTTVSTTTLFGAFVSLAGTVFIIYAIKK